MISIIAKLTFLHNIFSKLIIAIPVFLMHNFSKYMMIKKIFYNLSLDQVKGDCIEFGIFTGSSFKHSIRLNSKLNKFDNSSFYGLDSFEGFPDDSHPYFNQSNFKNSYEKTKKIEKKFPNSKIIKGFFSDSLKNNKDLQNITSLKFVFIDCDLYTSAIEPLDYITDKLVKGSYIMIDDFVNIDKNGRTISDLFFEKFQEKKVVFVSSFGVSGVVYRYLG
tara:strand:+ start:128 stop:784 length:657 start_codon:yes stop_codon:yes gene_type:complete